MKTDALFQYWEWFEQSQRSGKSSTSEKKPFDKFAADFDNAFLSTAIGHEVPKKRVTSVERAIQTLENIEITSTHPTDQVISKLRVDQDDLNFYEIQAVNKKTLRYSRQLQLLSRIDWFNSLTKITIRSGKPIHCYIFFSFAKRSIPRKSMVINHFLCAFLNN
jgi:hypothetical protein